MNFNKILKLFQGEIQDRIAFFIFGVLSTFALIIVFRFFFS